MAIGIPVYMDYLPKYRASGAVRRLFTELQKAKMKAVAANNDYVVTFDTTNNNYSIYNDVGNDDPDPGDLVKIVKIDEGFPDIEIGYVAGCKKTNNTDPITTAVTFGGDKVTFHSTGLAGPSGTIYLKPKEDTVRTDRSRAINVVRTGRIKIFKNNGSTWY